MVAHISAVPSEAKRGSQIPLDLEAQRVVNAPIWVLGTELRSFVIAVHTLYLDSSRHPAPPQANAFQS